jgi:hypothetical protein
VPGAQSHQTANVEPKGRSVRLDKDPSPLARIGAFAPLNPRCGYRPVWASSRWDGPRVNWRPPRRLQGAGCLSIPVIKYKRQRFGIRQ